MMAEPYSYEDFILQVSRSLMEKYWHPMWEVVKSNPGLIPIIPGFLIHPEKIIFYMGRTHIGIEYVGPEYLKELPKTHSTVETQCFDYSLKDCNLLDEIIGFKYDENTFKLPLPPISYNLVLPTNDGFDELHRLKWNWDAQNAIVGFNTNGVTAPENQFTRIVNGRFFDADESGLKVRYIRWLDLIPCEYDDSGDELDTFGISLSTFEKLAQNDPKLAFPLPEEFRLNRLQKINRFIELTGNQSFSETEITSKLADDDFQFIIKRSFTS